MFCTTFYTLESLHNRFTYPQAVWTLKILTPTLSLKENGRVHHNQQDYYHSCSRAVIGIQVQPSNFETCSASISILSMEVYRGSGIWCSSILNSIFCLSYCHVCQALLYVLYLVVVGNSLLGCHPEIRVVGNGSI